MRNRLPAWGLSCLLLSVLGCTGRPYQPAAQHPQAKPQQTAKVDEPATYSPSINADPGVQTSPVSTKSDVSPEAPRTTVVVSSDRVVTIRHSPAELSDYPEETSAGWAGDRQSPAASPGPYISSGPALAQAEAGPLLAAAPTARTSQPSKDPEAEELEKLLEGISGPVFQDKVHDRVAPKPIAEASPPTPSPTPVVEVTPPPPTPKPPSGVTTMVPPPPQPVPPEPPPITPAPWPVVSTPPEPRLPTIVVRQPPAEPTVEPLEAPAPGEPPIIIIAPPSPAPQSPPIPEAPPEVATPIVTSSAAEPPSEPTAIITIEVPAQPEPPAAEPGPLRLPQPIITVGPTEPAGEPLPPAGTTATIAPPPAAGVMPQRTGRVAKPWERLGNPAAAARDFYNHAPSLNNY